MVSFAHIAEYRASSFEFSLLCGYLLEVHPYRRAYAALRAAAFSKHHHRVASGFRNIGDAPPIAFHRCAQPPPAARFLGILRVHRRATFESIGRGNRLSRFVGLEILALLFAAQQENAVDVASLGVSVFRFSFIDPHGQMSRRALEHVRVLAVAEAFFKLSAGCRRYRCIGFRVRRHFLFFTFRQVIVTQISHVAYNFFDFHAVLFAVFYQRRKL